jgi:hypothetical protein
MNSETTEQLGSNAILKHRAALQQLHKPASRIAAAAHTTSSAAAEQNVNRFVTATYCVDGIDATQLQGQGAEMCTRLARPYPIVTC